MNWNKDDIERLVRATLERLAATGDAKTATGSNASRISDKATMSFGEFNLNVGVVGTIELRDVPQGIRSIAIRSSAIVTPAARDWLREKNIAVVTNAQTATPGAKSIATTPRSIVLGESIARYDASMLLSVLTKKGVLVERLARSGLETVAGELAMMAARDGRRAILLTDKPFAAVVAANRLSGARAAWLRDRDDAQRAVREIDANMAIVDPTGRSPYELTNVLTPFWER